MNYFSQTNSILYEIIKKEKLGKELSKEEKSIISCNPKGAFNQITIQGVLTMSVEELEALKKEYCIILSNQQYNSSISSLINIYSSMTPENFRYSMLNPSYLEITGITNLKKYAINSTSYINFGNLDQDSIGMNHSYSLDDITNSKLPIKLQELIKLEAMQRSQDIKDKLNSGMSLQEATNSKLKYKNILKKQK